MAVRRGLADRKKIMANGLVLKGRPEGVPLVRFDHSLFKHNGRLLRAAAIVTSGGSLEAMLFF